MSKRDFLSTEEWSPGEIDALLAHLDVALGDARSVEKVADQAAQVARLAAQHFARARAA